jgi:diguanylate cyclase (GGDEF)-like protein/putative nucleotidyltransferase with HDIG domain
MNTFREMPIKARAYWGTVVAMGLFWIAMALFRWPLQQKDALRIALYIIAAISCSGLKIRLPGIFGTLSMNYVVVIFSLLDSGIGAGLITGLASTLSQCTLHPTSRPRWFQVVFSVAGIPAPVMCAAFVLRSPYLYKADHSGCIALLAASLIYMGVNTLTVAGIIGFTTGKRLLEVWTNSYLWTYPQYLVGGAIAGAVHFLSGFLGWPAVCIGIPPLYLLYRSYGLYLGRIEQQQTHIKEMAELHLRTIETLALAIDAKDDTTAAHLRRVQIYASEIGKELGLSESEIQALEAAALLHDVGKLAVPEYIISKPGKLTPDEFEKMKVHPVVGAEILERVHFPYPVVPIVRSHHEKYDGTGYPDGLSGDQIPIGARILAAVDCLDALASNRQYRPAMPLADAMEIVSGESGKSFDPKVIEILRTRFRELELKAREETGNKVKLSSNVKVRRGASPATGFAEAPVTVMDAPAEESFSMAISGARREFQLLLEVTNDLGNSLSLEETLALLAVRLGKIVEHDAIAIYLLRDGKLAPRYVKGESYRLFNSLEIPLGQGLSGWVAENDLPIVNGNPAVEPGYLNDPTRVTPLRSAISVPLRARDCVVGVLTLYHMAPEAFSADHRRILLAVAPKAGVAIANSLRFEGAKTAADTDELTGLPNARYLFAHLKAKVDEHARTGGSFSTIVIDLDGFKLANDLYGHMAGNRVLQAMASVLTRNCRSRDLVARLGGDEFVLVLEKGPEETADVLARIEALTERIPEMSGCDAKISVSAGISRYPEDGTDAETLLERADERMYEVKGLKKGAAAALPRFSSSSQLVMEEALVGPWVQ